MKIKIFLFTLCFIIVMLGTVNILVFQFFTETCLVLMILGSIGLCVCATWEPTTPTTHLILEINEEVSQRIQQLLVETDSDSFSEVVSKGMAVYDCLWKEKSQGAKIFIEYYGGAKDGQKRELDLR